MTQYESVRTPQDYVNYTFNISAKGVTQVAGELAGLSSTVSTILGDIAFKTSEFLSHTETMALGAGAAISAVFIKSTQDAIRFEQQVANVKAIGGEAVNANLIGSKAMEYSNKFGMAVSEMTEGLEALARAGITTTSVMAGVLEEGVKLSKLEGIDLEDSINHLISTTNLLSQDNVDMNDPEYAEMLKAMNQHIVSTSESAPINAENIMQTLQHVGGYASASGIDQDDLFAVIAQLGARGTKGEMAGTALRAFIAAGNKDTAQRALERVGLNVRDLWKDNGETMLSISEMKDVLDSALEAKGYSKQEKLEFYADFAGYKQANQIMKIDTSEVENYKEQISNAWDLGTKLNTILGTVKGNLDRIWEISKNFMTKVGGKLLPIFNAILAPLRIGLELFTKIPFMDSLGAGLALFAGLRTILLVINNIVPAIGGLFSSMRNQKTYAKGIRGEWEKTRDAIKDAMEVLHAVSNKDKLAVIHRQRRGPSAEDKAKMENTIFEAMYYESPYYQELQIPWEEVTPALQHAIGRVFLGTPEFEENWRKMEERNEKIAEEIGSHAKVLNFGPYDAEGELQTINRYVQYIYSYIKNNKPDNSNRAKNKEAQAQKNRGGTTTTTSSSSSSTSSSNESSGGSSSGSTDTSSSSGTIKVEIVDGRQTSQSAFEFDDINQIKANIDVSQYGDYAHIYRNNKEQFIKDYNQAINDLVRKAFSFSNTDKARMDRTQSRRYEKSLRREAMSDEGLEYASRANDSDIRYFLETGVYRKPRHKMLGIKDNQIKAMARRLGLEGFDDIDNVRGEDNREQQLRQIREAFRSKNISVDELAKVANEEWIKTQKEKRSVTYVPTQLLRQYSDMTLQLAAMFTTPTQDLEQAIQQVQGFFETTTDEAKLATAAKVMMGQMKRSGQIFSDIEKEEINYILDNIVRLENTASTLGFELEKNMRVFKETADVNTNANVIKDMFNNGVASEIFDSIEEIANVYWDKLSIIPELVTQQYKQWLENEFYKISTPGGADSQVKVIDDVEDAIEDMEKTFVGGLNIEMDKFKDIVKNINNTFGSETNASNIDKRLKELNKQQESITNNIAVLERMKLAYSRQGQDVSVSELDANHEVKKAEIIKDTIEDYIITNPSPNRLSLDTLRDILSEQYEEPIVEELINWTRESAAKVNKLRGNKILHKSFTKPLARFMNPRLIPTGEETITLSNGDTVTLSTHSAPTKRNKDGTINHNVMNRYMHVHTDDDIRDFYAIREEYNDKLRHASHFDRTTVGMAILAGEGWNLDEIQKQLDIPDDKLPDYMKLANFSTAFDCASAGLDGVCELCDGVKKQCYAVRDASRLPKVTQNQIAKYIAFQLMSEEERVDFYENHGMPVRISQEGDFTSIDDYLEFLKIVEANTETTYYGYTKNEEVLAYIAEHGKPENLRMHNSLGTWDELNYIAVDLVDMVDYLKSGYKLCAGACLTCQQCFGDLEKFPEFKDINIVTVRRKGGDPLKKYKDIINNMELDKQIAFFADVQSLIRNEGATEKQAIEKAVENLTKMNVGNIDKNKVHHTKMKSPLTQEELLEKYGDDYFFLNPAVAYDIHKAESQGFQAISYVTPDEARKMIQMKGADISDFMPIRHVPGIETVRGSWDTYDDAQKENFFNVFLTNAEEHDNHLMVLTDKLYTTYKDILTDRYKEANKIRDKKDLPYVSSLRQSPWEFTPNAGMLMDEESPLGALLSIYNNMQSEFGSNTAISYDRMLSLAYDLIKVRFKDKESDYNISEDDFYKWIKDNQDMIDDIFQLDGDRSFYIISDLFQHSGMSVPQYRYNTMKASQQRRKEQEEALLNSPEFSQIQDLIISSYDGLMREGYHKITYTLLRNRVEEEANRLKISMDNYHQIFARTTLAPDEYTWSQHEDNPNKVFLIDPTHMSKAPADMYVEEVPMNTADFAKILPTTPEQAEDLLRDLLNNGKIIVTPSTDGSAHGSSSQGLIQITYDNDDINTGFMTLHEFAHSVALHMARNMRGVKTKRKAGDYDEDFDHEVEANQIALNIMKLAGFVLKDEESLAYAQKRVKSHKGVLRRRGALDLVNEDVIDSVTEAFWLHIDDIIAVLNATYEKDFSFLKNAALLNNQAIGKEKTYHNKQRKNPKNIFFPIAGHERGYLEAVFGDMYPDMEVLGYGDNVDNFQSYYESALIRFRKNHPGKKETIRNVLADGIFSRESERIKQYRLLTMKDGRLINLKDKDAVRYGYYDYDAITFKKLWGLTKKYKDLGFTQDDLLEWGVQAQDPQALKQFEIVNKKMFNAYKKHGDIGYWDWYNRITGEGKMGNFLETYKDIIPDIKTYLAEGMRFEAYTALIRQAKDIDYDDLDYEVSGDTLLSDDEKYSLQMEIDEYRGGKFKPTHTSAQIPNLHDELYNELQQLIREEHELIESIMETRIQHHKDNIEALNRILWEEINLPILYDNYLSDMENQEAKDERIYKQLIQEPSIPKSKDNRIKLTGEEMYDLVQASYWYNGGIGGNPQNTVDKYFTPIDAEKVKGKSLSEISFLNKDIAKNASYYVSKEDYEALKQVQSSYTLAQYGGQKAQTYVPGYMPRHYLNEAQYVYDKDKGRAVHADEYIKKKIAEGKSPDFLAPDNIRIPELQMLFDLYKDMGRSGIGYGLGTNQDNFQKFMRELFMSIDANENFTITNVRKLLQGHHSPIYLDEFLDNNENRIHNYGIYYDPKEWGRLINLLDTDAVKEAFMNDYITERQLKKWEKIYYTPRVNSEGEQNTYNFGQDNFGDLGYNMEMVQQWKQEKENIKQAQDINKMEKTEMRNQMFPSFMQLYINAMHNIEQYLQEVRDTLENKNNGPTLKDFDTSATNSTQDAQRSKQKKDIAQNNGQSTLNDFVTKQSNTQTETGPRPNEEERTDRQVVEGPTIIDIDEEDVRGVNEDNIFWEERKLRADAFWAAQERLEHEGVQEAAVGTAAKMFENLDKEYQASRPESKANYAFRQMFGEFEEWEEHRKINQFVDKIEKFFNKVHKTVQEKTQKINAWFDANFFPEFAEQGFELWGQTADELERTIEPLRVFTNGLNRLSQTFPVLIPLTFGLNKVLSTTDTIIKGLRNAEVFLMAVRIASGKVTDDLAEKEGYETAKKWAKKIKQYIPEDSPLMGFLGTFEDYGGRALLGMKTMIKDAIGFIAENFLILGPIVAAIAIAIGGLWISERNHAKALKEATEAQDKAISEASASYIIYQNLHKARQSETDAAKRQQLARKESIALYDLEAKRIEQLNAINKKSQLRSDGLWGEYGERARLQKMGWLESVFAEGIPFLGTIGKWLSGDFESQYEQYEGSTGEIRRIREQALSESLFSNSSTVAQWYDAHVQQLGQIETFAPELQKLYDLESSLIDKYGSQEAARDSKEFKEAVQEFADATGLNRETAEKYLDYLQTEANVENARKVMQAQVDMITAEANANAMKALYGDEAGLGDLDSVQDSMVYATADQIFKDAYNDLYWKMLMEWLNAIYNVITFNWGEAGKHAAAAGAYQQGMRELAENQARITQEGVDVAKENQRKEYGNQTYAYDYGDTTFGAAYDSAAAQEQDYLEEQIYSGISGTYSASRANGEAAVLGFKDGLNQHSPGDIAMAMADELGYMTHFITVFPTKIFSKLAQQQSDAYNNNLDIDTFDMVRDKANTVKRNRGNNIESIQKDILHVQRQTYSQIEDINKNVDHTTQWYTRGHNNGDNSYSARAKDALIYDKGFTLPPGVDPNDPEVQRELRRRQAETGIRTGAHGLNGIYQYLIGPNGRPIGAKGATRKGMEFLGHILNPEEVKMPFSSIFNKIFGKSGDDFIDVAGHVVDDATEIGAKSTDDILKLTGKSSDDVLKISTKGLSTAGKTGGRKAIKILGENTGEQAVKITARKGPSTVSKGGTKLLTKDGTKSLIKTGDKTITKAAGKGAEKTANKAGAKGIAKAGGKALAKAAPFAGPIVTGAFSIAEHNPFETHYNEDGSEKRALQSSGEVIGEVGGALAAQALGIIATGLAVETGPFAPLIGAAVEMGASLILEPVGKAVGGLIGWAGDELFNGAMGLLFTEDTENSPSPSQISNAVDSSTFDNFQSSFGSSSTFDNFADSSMNKSENIHVDNSRTEIHVHTLNINTEDDPEKIKTAFMNLVVELGDLAVPRQVSRTIGNAPSASTSSATENATEGTDSNNTNNNNSNNTNNNSNNNPTI